MKTRSKVLSTVGLAVLLIAPSTGCSKHEAPATPAASPQPASTSQAQFSLIGGWQCKLSMKAAPGFSYRAYHFGRDNVFAFADKDGENTALVAGAYQLSANQQQLRWIDGTFTISSPRGDVVIPWKVSQPGGEIIRSNFRDRQTLVIVSDSDNIVLRPVSIGSGPGGEYRSPNPPNDIPCTRQTNSAAEQAWRSVPRRLIAQMLGFYPLNPIPQFDPGQGQGPGQGQQLAPMAQPENTGSSDIHAAEEAALQAANRLNSTIAAFQSVQGCEGLLPTIYKSQESVHSMLADAVQSPSDAHRLRMFNSAERMANSAANMGKGSRCNP